MEIILATVGEDIFISYRDAPAGLALPESRAYRPLELHRELLPLDPRAVSRVWIDSDYFDFEVALDFLANAD